MSARKLWREVLYNTVPSLLKLADSCALFAEPFSDGLYNLNLSEAQACGPATKWRSTSTFYR